MSLEFAKYPFAAERYSAVLPPLHEGRDAQRRPAVVVGAGPVGLCAALGLANHGIPVVLLEADDSVCLGSRAICISRRSLEIAERLGALQGFLKVGLPWTGGRSFYRDTEVLHFQMPADKLQKLPPMINLAQYSIEQILLNRAREFGDLIDIRWQSKVTSINARDDGVRLTVSTPIGQYELDADWIVAADGGRSFIRESLGLALEGSSYEGRYVIVDILLESSRPTERLAYFDPPCNPGSTVLVHKQPGNVWRIDYQLRGDEDPDEAIKPENVAPRVASLLDMMGEKSAWKPIWITIYKANALTLPSYRHGRVLFAGDAAHLVPIFGVRGANSGIDDADNLAWKLAYVIKGLARESLLDSYSAERVAAAHENLRHGTKSTEFMAPPSFAFELMRTAVLGLAARHPALRSLINPRQSSAITYYDSPLNATAGNDTFAVGPVPGGVLPECPITITIDRVARPGHLTDLLCRRGRPAFVALAFATDHSQTEQLRHLERKLASRNIPFDALLIGQQAGAEGAVAHDPSGRLFEMYGASPGVVYLVRPDGHVLGRWKTPRPAELSAAIEHALGH